MPEFAKITPNLRDTISCWQQHYLKFSTLLERAASRHTWHLALQQAIFLTSKVPYFLFPKAPPSLSMKEGSLFCSYEIQRTGMLEIVFLVSWESSRRGGVHGLGSMTFGLAVQKFLNIEWFLHWKSNHIVAENFGGIGMLPLVLLERSCWVGFNGTYLVRFGFRMWVTFGPMAQATLVNMK